MCFSIHAVTGMLIGSQAKNSLIAFLFGLLSHFLWDAIPHGDKFLDKKPGKGRAKIAYYVAFIDILIATVLTIVFYKRAELANFKIISWAICGAILPDIICSIYELSKFRLFKNFNDLHHFVHHPDKAIIRTSVGLVFQITILTFIAILLFSN